MKQYLWRSDATAATYDLIESRVCLNYLYAFGDFVLVNDASDWSVSQNLKIAHARAVVERPPLRLVFG
jgi:hypothetical protein